MPIVKCDYCGKQFLKSINQMFTAHNFCNRKCNADFKRNKVWSLNEIQQKEDYSEIIINSKKYGKLFVKIDLDDVEKVKNLHWCVAKCGNVFYAVTKINKKSIRMHRVIIGFDNELIDHINRDGLDNRKSNLRITTKSENRFNSRVSKNNTHGNKGITYNKVNKGWVAHIKKDGKTYCTPYTKTKEEAIRLRAEMEIKYYGYNT